MSAPETSVPRPPPRVPAALPLVAAMAALALIAWRMHSRTESDAVPRRASVVARVIETQAALPRLDPGRSELLRAMMGSSLADVAPRVDAPWDRAVLAVLAADAGRVDLAREVLRAKGPPDDERGRAFRASFDAAFGDAPLPTREERASVDEALGRGLAAALLESRLVAREGGDGEAAIAAVMTRLRPRLLLLVAGSLALVPLALLGVGFGAWLLALPRSAPAEPGRLRMSGALLATVLVAWACALLASGALVPRLSAELPALAPLAIPLGYLLHAGIGLALACWAEGTTPSGLWRRLSPGPAGRAIAFGLAFYATTLVTLFAVGVLVQLATRRIAPLQPELLDRLTGTKGALPVLLTFATVAVLAPLFEELIFRGLVLHWLLERAGRPFAVAASALLFALLHLSPAALPALFALGVMLGLAALRARSLAASVVVHGLWNGAAFVLARTLS